MHKTKKFEGHHSSSVPRMRKKIDSSKKLSQIKSKKGIRVLKTRVKIDQIRKKNESESKHRGRIDIFKRDGITVEYNKLILTPEKKAFIQGLKAIKQLIDKYRKKLNLPARINLKTVNGSNFYFSLRGKMIILNIKGFFVCDKKIDVYEISHEASVNYAAQMKSINTLLTKIKNDKNLSKSQKEKMSRCATYPSLLINQRNSKKTNIKLSDLKEIPENYRRLFLNHFKIFKKLIKSLSEVKSKLQLLKLTELINNSKFTMSYNSINSFFLSRHDLKTKQKKEYHFLNECMIGMKVLDAKGREIKRVIFIRGTENPSTITYYSPDHYSNVLKEEYYDENKKLRYVVRRINAKKWRYNYYDNAQKISHFKIQTSKVDHTELPPKIAGIYYDNGKKILWNYDTLKKRLGHKLKPLDYYNKYFLKAIKTKGDFKIFENNFKDHSRKSFPKLLSRKIREYGMKLFKIEDRTRKIQAKYGIKYFSFKKTSPLFRIALSIEPNNGSEKMIKPKEMPVNKIDQALAFLEKSFQVFPPGMLKTLNPARSISFIPEGRNSSAFLLKSLSGYQEIYFAKEYAKADATFHSLYSQKLTSVGLLVHELNHGFEKFGIRIIPLNKWAQIAYGKNYKKQYLGGKYFLLGNNELPKGVFRAYQLKDVFEDRSDTMMVLLGSPQIYTFIHKKFAKDEIFMRKIRMMKEILYVLSQKKMDNKFWKDWSNGVVINETYWEKRDRLKNYKKMTLKYARYIKITNRKPRRWWQRKWHPLDTP